MGACCEGRRAEATVMTEMMSFGTVENSYRGCSRYICTYSIGASELYLIAINDAFSFRRLLTSSFITADRLAQSNQLEVMLTVFQSKPTL